MRRPNEDIAARRGDAPADRRDGSAAMGCAGQTKILRRGEEMRRPIEEMAGRRWDAPAKQGDELEEQRPLALDDIEEQRPSTLEEIEGQRPLALDEIEEQRPSACDDILKSSARRREMIF